MFEHSIQDYYIMGFQSSSTLEVEDSTVTFREQKMGLECCYLLNRKFEALGNGTTIRH